MYLEKAAIKTSKHSLENTAKKAATKGVLKKKIFFKFRNIHWNTPVLESLFNKDASLKDCNFF